MIVVRRYGPEDEDLWNQFNDKGKNSMFMFDRKYMDYHKDRFEDHSLLFYKGEELVAVLPMNKDGKSLVSHGGLTYGGFITNEKMKQNTMDECFDALVEYGNKHNIKEIIYKALPHIYHSQPAEEDQYSLFLKNARIGKIEASTTLNLQNPLKMAKGRKAQVSRAKREGVVVSELTGALDNHKFIDLENEVLFERHKTKAVHSGDELELLHSRFPNNIRIFGALKDNELIAGTVIFEYAKVIHTQYMAANEYARRIGALDYVINHIIDQYSTKLWLDFGISTEQDGRVLNQGLKSQKEGFGGRTTVYQTWIIDI